MIAWALLYGCPKPPAVPPATGAPVDEVVQRTVVSGPRYWSEGGGLCLEVPDGWVGTTGPGPLLLELEQRESGVRLEVLAHAEGLAAPAPRPGFVVMFEDAGSYRRVPILTPSATRTSEAIDPIGPSVHAWYAPLGGRLVEIAAVIPFGRSTEGLTAVDPLLRALCTTSR